jgi:hypothetical protein
MTQRQFNQLARKIFACETATTDPTKQCYWAKHFVRLISLVRNQNTFGV